MGIPAETLERMRNLPEDQITVILELIGFYDQKSKSEQPKTFINRIGDLILITPLEKAKKVFLDSFDLFTDDFMEDGRREVPDSARENL